MTPKEPGRAPKNAHRLGPGANLAPREADDDAAFRRALERARARLSEPVAAAIQNYAPTLLSKKQKKRVLPFIREAVTAVEPLNVFTAQQYATALAGLVSWAHLTNGHPLSRGLLLSPTLIGMYVADLQRSGASAGSVSNRRGYLRHTAEALGITATERPQAIIGGRPPAAPYSAQEEAAFRLWAWTDWPDEISRARALALVGLAAGAGLSNAELALVRARDLIDQAGLWVTVRGARPRVVPVRGEWAGLLRRRLGSLSSDDLLFPHDATSNPKFVEAWVSGLNPRHRPVPGRLRATWIVAMLRDRAQPEAVVAWSGVARGETIAKYLRYAPEVATEALRRAYIRIHSTVPGTSA